MSTRTLSLNTVVGTFWHGARLGCQILALVLVARALGGADYGSLTGAAGLALVFGSLTGLGGGLLLLQHVAAGTATFDQHWSATLRLIATSGLALTLLYAAVAPLLLKTHPGLIPLLALGIAEILLQPFITACSLAFHAHERLGWTTALQAAAMFCRLLGAITFTHFTPHPSLASYAPYHLAAALLAAAFAFTALQRLLKPKPSPGSRHPWMELRSGLALAGSNLAAIGYGEADKILAVRLLGTTAAGNYSIAYRIIHASSVPVFTLLQALQPRLLRSIAEQQWPALKQAVTLAVLATLLYSPIACLFLAAGAHLLPTLLGPSFAEASAALLMLLPLLPLFLLRTLAGNLLAASGRPMQRALLEAAGIALLVILGSHLVPSLGARGAILSVLATEATLLAALGWAAWRSLQWPLSSTRARRS